MVHPQVRRLGETSEDSGRQVAETQLVLSARILAQAGVVLEAQNLPAAPVRIAICGAMFLENQEH
jgi:hypothetical protein